MRENDALLFEYLYDSHGRRVKGLHYFGARWYDASLGRFISEDPLKGSMISSQSQNPYVYCMNNPLRYIDPSGMLMAEGGAYHEGYLQSYSGGYWIYYPESGGSCNVSGEGYREDHFAPSQPNTTPPATLPDCASYGGKDPRKSYAPNCATYGGNRPPITKPGATFDINYVDNAFNGYDFDPVTWRLDITGSFYIGELSLTIMHDPEGNWSVGLIPAFGLSYSPTCVPTVTAVNLPQYNSIQEYRESGNLNGANTRITAVCGPRTSYIENNRGEGSFVFVFGGPTVSMVTETPYVPLLDNFDWKW